MKRALQLAQNGEGRVSPNPMVGAVIVHDGRIIGEGYHAYYGGPHAEVNAINSVKPEDLPFLKDSTIYVTLEPCAHYGKTPPCASLIVEKGIPNVVVGTLDPNPLVAGKGIKILNDAGISVKEGILEKECQEINRRFMFAQTSERPWIILKWAQSSDGFIASYDVNGQSIPVKFSSPVTSVWMHRGRSKVDAIMVGSNTESIDHPRLDVRLWGGNSPKKIVAKNSLDLDLFLKDLRKEGVTSLLVEGGAELLNSFISKGLYNEIRVETAPMILHEGLKAPLLPQDIKLVESLPVDGRIIQLYHKD